LTELGLLFRTFEIFDTMPAFGYVPARISDVWLLHGVKMELPALYSLSDPARKINNLVGVTPDTFQRTNNNGEKTTQPKPHTQNHFFFSMNTQQRWYGTCRMSDKCQR
jgi:hypothetical protein